MTVRTVTWPGEHLRRASEAVADHVRRGPPFDTIAIAVAACEAAVRTQADLEKLHDNPNAAFQSKKKNPRVMLRAHRNG